MKNRLLPFCILLIFCHSKNVSLIFPLISRCQTYEGGFGGVPGMEAHGGYSFCGLAALMFLNKGHLCNIDALLKWAANRQMRVEGGFQVIKIIIKLRTIHWPK